MPKKTTQHTRFWDSATALDADNRKDPITLAMYQRAISNFVSILTGLSIPVKFKTSSPSYTDGQEVVIGGNVSDANFDYVCGLALHEASHIAYTDFEVVRNTFKVFNERDARLKMLTNIVEDRRIDKIVFDSAPGYRPYYHAMYNKYFNSKAIDKALKLGMKNDATSFDDYIFHICNFANPNRNLDTLPALREIWDLFGLANISRLKNVEDSIQVANSILEVIEREVGDAVQDQPNQEKVSTEEAVDDETASDNPLGGGSGEGSGEQEDDQAEEQGGLDPRLVERVEKAFEKQKDFVSGNVKKSNLSRKAAEEVKAIQASGVTRVENDFQPDNDFIVYNKDTILISKPSKGIVSTDMWREAFGAALSHRFTKSDSLEGFTLSRKIIGYTETGLRRGSILGRRLQFRNDERLNTNTRQKRGRIDRRLLAGLGFDSESVFKTTFVEKCQDVFMHISIDASGSMSGLPFEECQTSALAIAKAATTLKNVDVVISYRSTTRKVPVVAVVYDSRTMKLKDCIPYIMGVRPRGATPEGLCYEVLGDFILESNDDRKSYFINFSDGQPFFAQSGYLGSAAEEHTRREVEKMRNKGIHILSYFIDTSSVNYWAINSGNDEAFKRMYGADAETIQVSHIPSLVKTLNKLLSN